MPSRAFCSVCSGYFVLKRDGTVWAHKRFDPPSKYGARSWWKPCEGAGKPPLELDR